MTTLEYAHDKVKQLVHKFKALSPAARKQMNEDATRQGYLLPLFGALGWDIEDINEVSPEERVSKGWVDFAFRIGGIPRFFLETKKASEDLDDPRWVKQAIDYAWHKSVTWALLSDFEGLRVFNAEWQEADPDRAEYDAARTAWLETQGYHVIRFDNADVHNNPGSVLEAIWAACEKFSQWPEK